MWNGQLVEGQGTGAIRFTAGQSGRVSIGVLVENGAGASATAEASLAIVPLPAAPSVQAPRFVLAGLPGATAVADAPGAARVRWEISHGTIAANASGSSATFAAGADSVTLRAIALNAAGDGTSTTVAVSRGSTGLQIFAGAPGGPGFVDGAGDEARMLSPVGVAAGAADDVFIADYGTIRRWADGHLTTFVGSIARQMGAAGSCAGAGTSAVFPWPTGVARGSDGFLYVSTNDKRVCRIDSEGNVSPFATVSGGAATIAAGADKIATFGGRIVTELDYQGAVLAETTIDPIDGWQASAIGIDLEGRVYVSGRRGAAAIVVAVSGGTAETVFTTASPWPYGCDTASLLCAPTSLLVEPDGALLVADFGHAILARIRGGSGVVAAGVRGMSGLRDGPARAALLTAPIGLSRTVAGDVFFTDARAGLLRKLSADGHVSTLAGIPDKSGAVDGYGIAARLEMPVAVAVAPSGHVWTAEMGGRIARVTPEGVLTTVATLTSMPTHAVVGPSGELLVSCYDSVIRAVGADGSVRVFAGVSGAGFQDGPAGSARFGAFRISSSQTTEGAAGGAMAFDGLDTVYVADAANGRVRAIKAGEVTTWHDHGLSAPPEGVSVAGGHVYVLVGTSVERRTAAGELVEVNGFGATLRQASIAADAGGTVFITDPGRSRVLRQGSTGLGTTLAGDAARFGILEGPLPADFGSPVSIAIAPAGAPNAGALFLADFADDAIVMIRP